MSYTPNVPLSSDIISETQPTILTNFQVLNTIFGNDHYQYTDSSTLRGKHKFTTFPDRRGSAPTTLADEQSFYNSRLEAAAGGAVRVVGKNRNAGAAANQIFPVSPFAMAVITNPAGNGACSISAYSLNVASANKTAGVVTITFHEAAPATLPYIAFAISYGTVNRPLTISARTTTTFSVTFVDNTGNSEVFAIAVWCFPE